MPKREDIKTILIIGSGPIVIGQACEFDYSGTQACKALKNAGYRVILLNSNPATIMTDPEIADKTYIEPIRPSVLEHIFKNDDVDAVISTLGGQTAINLVKEAEKLGLFKKYNVEILGADIKTLELAENREEFRKLMLKKGIPVLPGKVISNLKEAEKIADEIGFPLVVRPSYTLGGIGGGIAYNREELVEQVAKGIIDSPVRQVLIEKGVIGWKEFEFEVMRDKADNAVIVCSIENMDPMGVHTGDSITVAPAQTLSDELYQKLRTTSIEVLRAVGVNTGGSNVQFAVHPETDEFYVIEMNPRVSRSSALASKATGFPIAKIAALLAVGFTLDEIPNDITKETPASFEPVLDYVVVKIPRFNFEKFYPSNHKNRELTTQMKSVGEVMAIGRSFPEALQKAIRSLEIGRAGLGADGKDKIKILDEFVDKWSIVKDDYFPLIKGQPNTTVQEINMNYLKKYLVVPNDERLFFLRYALQLGIAAPNLQRITGIDAWFILKIWEIVKIERQLKQYNISNVPDDLLRQAKNYGFSDIQLAYLLNCTEKEIRQKRDELNLKPVFKAVDTCAGEFQAYTPYFYSCYDIENDVSLLNEQKKKILIIGSGPNRIGQGIEFDYCCVRAVQKVKTLGYQAIMINNNPETVSTDYDVADKLYFEPITYEDVMNVIEKEKPEGVIIQFGGQTPLKLAEKLKDFIIGTDFESIHRAEDRGELSKLCAEIGIKQPENRIIHSLDEAVKAAEELKYPVLLRPSYVLGGRAMKIVYDRRELEQYIEDAVEVSEKHPVLMDKYLIDATEIDVDAVSDSENTFVAAIMEHIEYAGVHSGDSAAILPPQSVDKKILQKIEEATKKIASALNIKGLLNIQFAIKDNEIYLLEVNPRASRTIPFVSKAIGVPLVDLAVEIMLGKKLNELAYHPSKEHFVFVKEVVFPFSRFPGTDIVLGPEMKSTGEVMGVGANFEEAFAKAQIAAGMRLPKSGTVFISVCNEKKEKIIPIARELKKMNFKLYTTIGTHLFLKKNKIKSKYIKKVSEGRPNIVDLLQSGKINMIINIPNKGNIMSDGYIIRQEAIKHNIPIITTIDAAEAAIKAIKNIRKKDVKFYALQDINNSPHSHV